MAVQITMPQLGLTMTEGKVTRWFKAVGEPVQKGELIVEIETDKINNQIEAPESGVVAQILAPEGAVVPVKALLAVIGGAGEAVEIQAAAASEAARPVHTAGWVKASPAARKLARQRQIDLSLVTGTGPEGRVIEKDVLMFSERGDKIRLSPLAAKMAAEYGVDLAGLPSGQRLMKADVIAVLPKPAPAFTGMRKIIAERMSLSWQTAPHVHLTVEVDMSAAKELKQTLTVRAGAKVSFTEIIVKCAVKALQEFPDMNAAFIDNQITRFEAVNIGVAVALDEGLIVPVIKDAQVKTISAIGREIAELRDKARQGTLLPADIAGGTFTVTNLGMFGADHFTPIINPPESAILGVCKIVDRPVAADGRVVVRPIMNLCLGFDHRLIDGAVAAKFMARIRDLLEAPVLLLM